MKLKDEAIQEFAAIWRDEFGEELTYDQARAEAQSLLSLFLLLLKRDEPQSSKVPPSS